MNFKQMLMMAGAAYAVGRLSANLTGDDLRMFGDKLRHLTGDDVRKYALGLTDDALDRAGLIRRANVPNGTAMMIGGLGAGILVGAGLALLFAPQTGAEIRSTIADKVKNIRTNGASDQPEGAGGQ